MVDLKIGLIEKKIFKEENLKDKRLFQDKKEIFQIKKYLQFKKIFSREFSSQVNSKNNSIGKIFRNPKRKC